MTQVDRPEAPETTPLTAVATSGGIGLPTAQEQPGPAAGRLSFGAAAVIGGLVIGGLIVAIVLSVTVAFLNIVTLAERTRDLVVPQVIAQQERAVMAADLARVAERTHGARDPAERAGALEEAEAIGRRFARVAEAAVLADLDAALAAMRQATYRADVLDALQAEIDALLARLDADPGRPVPATPTPTSLALVYLLHAGARAGDAQAISALAEQFAIIRPPGDDGLAAFGVVFDLRREQLQVMDEARTATATARRLLTALTAGLSADAAQRARDGADRIVAEAWAGIRTATLALAIAVVATGVAVALLLTQVVGPILRAAGALEAMEHGQPAPRLPAVRLRELEAVGRSVGRLGAVLAQIKIKEATAERARHNLQHVFDVSPVPLVVERLEDAIILEANHAACAALGLEHRLLVGRPAGAFWVQAGRRAEVVDHLAREHRLDNAEVHLRTADGRDFWALLSSRLIERNGARVMLSGFHDITERKAYETRLHTLVAELEGSNRDLEQFAYVASHDLQEPLRLIGSYLQLLERRFGERLDDDGRTFIGYAVDAARRMQALVAGLLDYSRVGRAGRPAAAVDCMPVLAQARGSLALAIGEAGAVVEIPAALPTVRGDAGSLERLFLNLLANALRYRADGRPCRIVVSVEAGAAEEWLFAVADTGIGIPAEATERVFQLFNRLEPGRLESGPAGGGRRGTGIGLAICRKIVEQHGGRIWIDSSRGAERAGEGCTVRFTLPAA